MDAKNPKRRWFRFSLRTVFVVVTLACIWLGFVRSRAVERQAFKLEVEAAGGAINCRYQFGDPRYFQDPSTRLSRAMGDPGGMTTVILPGVSMYRRALPIYPEATIWSYDDLGQLILLNGLDF